MAAELRSEIELFNPTAGAERLVTQTKEIAYLLKHPTVRTHHLLLALTGLPWSGPVLEYSGITQHLVRKTIYDIAGFGNVYPKEDQFSTSPQVLRVVEIASKSASIRKAKQLDTAHILEGLGVVYRSGLGEVEEVLEKRGGLTLSLLRDRQLLRRVRELERRALLLEKPN